LLGCLAELVAQPQAVLPVPAQPQAQVPVLALVAAAQVPVLALVAAQNRESLRRQR
jgi:hypothetical protein